MTVVGYKGTARLLLGDLDLFATMRAKFLFTLIGFFTLAAFVAKPYSCFP